MSGHEFQRNWHGDWPAGALHQRMDPGAAPTNAATANAAARSIAHPGREYEAEYQRQRSGARQHTGASGAKLKPPPRGGDFDMDWQPTAARRTRSLTATSPPMSRSRASKIIAAASGARLVSDTAMGPSPRAQVDLLRLLRGQQREPRGLGRQGGARPRSSHNRVPDGREATPPRGGRSGRTAAARRGPAARPAGPGKHGPKKSISHIAGTKPQPREHAKHQPPLPGRPAGGRKGSPAARTHGRGGQDAPRGQQTNEAYAAELKALIGEIRDLLKQAVAGAAPPPLRPLQPGARLPLSSTAATSNTLALAAQRKAALGSNV